MSYRSLWSVSKAVATSALLLSIAACATSNTKVRVDKDASADFSKCRTFGWLSQPSGAAGSLSEQRIHIETMAVLRSKGYSIDETQPDCRVSYVLDIREKPGSKPGVGVGVGGGSGGFGGGIGISLPLGKRAKQTGTLTLDVLDEARKAQIWSGSSDSDFSGKEISPDEARALVRQILGEYPGRK